MEIYVNENIKSLDSLFVIKVNFLWIKICVLIFLNIIWK